jgi:hypothetical protein
LRKIFEPEWRKHGDEQRETSYPLRLATYYKDEQKTEGGMGWSYGRQETEENT